jgi:TRAP-type C4-dicarboxylate transport system permease small subunit
MMAISVQDNIIPTLGISEAYRYLPGIVAGVLIILFSIEHLIAMARGREVVKSWH